MEIRDARLGRYRQGHAKRMHRSEMASCALVLLLFALFVAAAGAFGRAFGGPGAVSGLFVLLLLSSGMHPAMLGMTRKSGQGRTGIKSADLQHATIGAMSAPDRRNV